jgi:NADH-quinone oxidoreductase E subunit
MVVTFSSETLEKLARIVARYPRRQAACLPALHIAQKEFGYLHDDALRAVGEYLDLPYAHVFGVATFYTMLRLAPTPPNVLRVCTNVSCMLRGAYDILGHIEKKLGIKAGQSTPDGAFALVEEECLAACANAPMMICGTQYFLDLSPEKVDVILDDLRKRYEEGKKARRPDGGPKA